MGNPLLLAGILTLLSVILAIINWHKTPERVPLWWDLHEHPILFVPRWVGLLLLPVLTLLIPYLLWLISSQDSNLQSSGEESKRSADHIILLPALFLFVAQNFTVLPAAKSESHDFGARFFVATIAVFLLWLGHLVQNLEPNSVLGLITPWTTDSGNYVYTQQIGGKILAVSAVILLIASWLVPIGWLLLLVLLVFWLGPFVVVWGLSYGYTTSSSGGNQPLLNNN